MPNCWQITLPSHKSRLANDFCTESGQCLNEQHPSLVAKIRKLVRVFGNLFSYPLPTRLADGRVQPSIRAVIAPTKGMIYVGKVVGNLLMMRDGGSLSWLQLKSWHEACCT